MAGGKAEALLGEETGVMSRNAHEDRGPRECAQHIDCIETFEPDDAIGTEESRVESDIKTVNVEYRQGMEENIVRREGPGAMKGRGIGQEIVMAQHCALGAAGRARGIEKAREIVGPAGAGLVMRVMAGSFSSERAGRKPVEFGMFRPMAARDRLQACGFLG